MSDPDSCARSFAAAAPYQVNILMFGGTNSTGAQLNDSWYYQWFGGTCTVNAQCPPPPGGSTGYCVDNVCCNNACDGGTLGNCQACSIARGAVSDDEILSRLLALNQERAAGS